MEGLDTCLHAWATSRLRGSAGFCSRISIPDASTPPRGSIVHGLDHASRPASLMLALSLRSSLFLLAPFHLLFCSLVTLTFSCPFSLSSVSLPFDHASSSFHFPLIIALAHPSSCIKRDSPYAIAPSPTFVPVSPFFHPVSSPTSCPSSIIPYHSCSTKACTCT
jgi:hypothetical protein